MSWDEFSSGSAKLVEERCNVSTRCSLGKEHREQRRRSLQLGPSLPLHDHAVVVLFNHMMSPCSAPPQSKVATAMILICAVLMSKEDSSGSLVSLSLVNP